MCSISSGDINAKIVTPNKETISLKLKDNGNGTFTGEFKSLERGKFQILWKDKIKYFILNDIRNKEVEEITSTDYKIKKYIEKNNAFTKNFNIIWNDQSVPKVLRIYNNKNPFISDNQHLHHFIIKAFSKKAVLPLYLSISFTPFILTYFLNEKYYLYLLIFYIIIYVIIIQLLKKKIKNV